MHFPLFFRDSGELGIWLQRIRTGPSQADPDAIIWSHSLTWPARPDRNENSAQFEAADNDAVSANPIWISSARLWHVPKFSHLREPAAFSTLESRIEINAIFSSSALTATISNRTTGVSHNYRVVLGVHRETRFIARLTVFPLSISSAISADGSFIPGILWIWDREPAGRSPGPGMTGSPNWWNRQQVDSRYSSLCSARAATLICK